MHCIHIQIQREANFFLSWEIMGKTFQDFWQVPKTIAIVWYVFKLNHTHSHMSLCLESQKAYSNKFIHGKLDQVYWLFLFSWLYFLLVGTQESKRIVALAGYLIICINWAFLCLAGSLLLFLLWWYGKVRYINNPYV